jgi:glycosyltransferase involved in cell wall biosynthesis
MTNKSSIVYLGCPGFPYGLAEVQKIILISKSLILKNYSVTVICKRGLHDKTGYPELKACGEHENIKYVYTSGNPFRSDNFIKRNILKVKGAIIEFYLLKRMGKNNNLDYAILSTQNFYAVLYYTILSKLLGFKVILNYVEFFSGVEKKWYQINSRINDFLYDTYGPILVDAVFPISEFLINRIKEISPSKKYLKIPALTDFSRYENIPTIHEHKYFLFCGDAGYKEIIIFIIDSYNFLPASSSSLYLIINGDKNSITEIKKYIVRSPKKNLIKVFSKISDYELYSYYKNAMALLIPLRPNLKDLARFPHKTGEYLASGNPVISTNYGEIKYYFKDMCNMLIADNYDIISFSNKMQFVIDNPLLAKKIGLNGKEIALRIFDYRAQADSIHNFLDSELLSK